MTLFCFVLCRSPLDFGWLCVTLHVGRAENTGSPSHADLPNTDTFHYATSKKSHLLISPPVSPRRVLGVGKAGTFTVAGTGFPESRQWLSGSLRSFLRKRLPDTQVFVARVCH